MRDNQCTIFFQVWPLDLSSMAPRDPAEIRAIFRERIAAARNKKGWNEAKLADEAGLKTITVKRWEKEEGTSPYLTDAKKAAHALDVSLDWLTGHELTPAETVASVAARADEEVRQMHVRLDQLIADLTEARLAFVGNAKVAATTGRRSRRQRAEKIDESVAVPREAAR